MFLYHGHCTLQAKPCLNSAPHSTCPVGILKDFSHTHTKIQTTGFWQRNMGTTSAASLKMNNTSTRVIWGCRSRFMWKPQGSPAKQPPSNMNGNFKKCKSDGTTKKNLAIGILSLTHDRKCTLNSIFYMVVWNFCNGKPEHMAQSFQTNPCW